MRGGAEERVDRGRGCSPRADRHRATPSPRPGDGRASRRGCGRGRRRPRRSQPRTEDRRPAQDPARASAPSATWSTTQIGGREVGGGRRAATVLRRLDPPADAPITTRSRVLLSPLATGRPATGSDERRRGVKQPESRLQRGARPVAAPRRSERRARTRRGPGDGAARRRPPRQMRRALARAAAAGGRTDDAVHRSSAQDAGDASRARVHRRRVMAGDDGGDVAKLPAGRGEPDGESALLTSDAVARVEAAGEERVAPQDRAARDDPEHLVSQRAAPHRDARRIEAFLSPPGPAPRRPRGAVRVERRDGTLQRARGPTRSRRREARRRALRSAVRPRCAADAPWPCVRRTSPPGKRAATASAVSSRDASSTTTIAGRGNAVTRASVASTLSRRSRAAMTTLTRTALVYPRGAAAGTALESEC